MERDLFRRCVRRVRDFLAPRWGNGRRGLRKFVRRLLAPFRENPHILSELLRTPAKVLAIAGLAWGLTGTPSVAPAKMNARAEAFRGVPAATQQVVLTDARDLFASDGWRGEANLGTSGARKEVAFIDLGVAMPGAIARAVKPGTEIHYIQADRSGIEQISEVLAASQDIDAIHLLSHGGPGYVNLGTDVVNREILAYYADAVRAWRSSLSVKADILVYGCEVARSEEGKAFLSDVARLTGADVAGSDDVTGAKRLGGDWMLETSFGMIDVAGLSAPSYEGTLLDYPVTNGNNSGAGSLRQAIIDANDNAGPDTISFPTSPLTVNLASDLPQITDDVEINGYGRYYTYVTGTTIRSLMYTVPRRLVRP